ncbi:hypothetical protein HYDPIDRAFT_116567 [Hydnomerulius pinastri MD-312]|uniref:Membrane insertase YidC/Oxa/ALB C-terminal domain-containing protein n=1 Tax=Hydnomerulius pinastri MD-312 TaxID=994086 RepID=A0A0C9W3Q4_9AGAM|nr:hypothetical protein HYDPIDRAFT_116567 [Hydnomerulius pinastri MD-312]
MVLSATLCAGGRLGLRTSGSRIAPLVSHQPRSRLLSLQHSRLLISSLPPTQGISNTRSYWWSKPSTPVAATTEASSPPPPEPAAAASSIHEVPPVPESAPPDAIAQTVSSPDTAPSLDAISEALPVDPSTMASELSQIASNVIPPLQYGDLAALGIAGWSPAGLIRWSFELLQVTTGMPWFYAIITGTLLWRVALVPNSIKAVRNAAKLRPYAEEIKALDTKAATGDHIQKMEATHKKTKIIEKAGVNMGEMFLSPVVQVTVNLGLFFAVKKLVTLPVEQLSQSGVWLVPDLTAADPTYILPAVVALLIKLQTSVMKRDLDPTKPIFPHVLNVMPLFSLASIPWMIGLPSGLWLSVITGQAVSVVQSSLLQLPKVRQALKMPPMIEMPRVTMLDTARAVRKWYFETRQQALQSASNAPAPTPVRRARSRTAGKSK